jgi:hypothetical protein
MPYELLPVSKNQTTKSCSPELSAFSQGAEGKRFKPAVQIQDPWQRIESLCVMLCSLWTTGTMTRSASIEVEIQ